MSEKAKRTETSCVARTLTSERCPAKIRRGDVLSVAHNIAVRCRIRKT